MPHIAIVRLNIICAKLSARGRMVSTGRMSEELQVEIVTALVKHVAQT